MADIDPRLAALVAAFSRSQLGQAQTQFNEDGLGRAAETTLGLRDEANMPDFSELLQAPPGAASMSANEAKQQKILDVMDMLGTAILAGGAAAEGRDITPILEGSRTRRREAETERISAENRQVKLEELKARSRVESEVRDNARRIREEQIKADAKIKEAREKAKSDDIKTRTDAAMDVIEAQSKVGAEIPSEKQRAILQRFNVPVNQTTLAQAQAAASVGVARRPEADDAVSPAQRRLLFESSLSGITDVVESETRTLGRPLSPEEIDEIIKDFPNLAFGGLPRTRAQLRAATNKAAVGKPASVSESSTLLKMRRDKAFMEQALNVIQAREAGTLSPEEARRLRSIEAGVIKSPIADFLGFPPDELAEMIAATEDVLDQFSPASPHETRGLNALSAFIDAELTAGRCDPREPTCPTNGRYQKLKAELFEGQ